MTDSDRDTPRTSAGTVSRTQRKREALDLQRIGARLVALEAGELAKLPLPEELADAVHACRRIRAHEGRRRQLQFIGKLMRRIDPEPVLEALAALEGDSARSRYEFHQLESWREKLIEEDGALTEYLNAHPQADRQQLRRLIARVRGAADENQRKKESRALFRLLRETEAEG